MSFKRLYWCHVYDKIFELYFTTKKEGSGIGLAETYQFLQWHYGSVDFDRPKARGLRSAFISCGRAGNHAESGAGCRGRGRVVKTLSPRCKGVESSVRGFDPWGSHDSGRDLSRWRFFQPERGISSNGESLALIPSRSGRNAEAAELYHRTESRELDRNSRADPDQCKSFDHPKRKKHKKSLRTATAIRLSPRTQREIPHRRSRLQGPTPPLQQTARPRKSSCARRTSEPGIQLAGGTAQTKTRSRETLRPDAGATEENLKKIAGRPLSSDQQDMLNQVHQFMEQTKRAVTAGDMERAHTLAKKAQTLSEELAKPQQ